VGRDRLNDKPEQAEEVSIHAPAWGATLSPELASGWEKFQSTRPRGARHASGWPFEQISGFNPRARVGRD